MHILKTSTLLAAVALGTSGNLFAQQAAPVANPAAAPAPAAAVAKPVPAAKPVAPVAAKPAPAPTKYAPVITPEKPRYAISIGAGAQAVQFDDDATQDTLLYGATVSVSGFLSKTRPFLKNTLLIADAGFYFGDYTDTLLWEESAYVVPGSQLRQRDVSTRKNTQFNLPVLLTLAYEFEAGKHFRFRLGPSLGFTFVSIESKYNGSIQISEPLDPLNPNSPYIPIGETNSVSDKRSGSKAIFSYGATAGATWNITNRLHADFQYRITGNEAVDFGFARNFGKSVIHQANLSLGWRF